MFYQPSDQGYEAGIQTQVARRREAQLAALVESVLETLTYGPTNQQQDRWLQRATGVLGEQLGEVRDRLFNTLNARRHHLLLDLNASTGLLTWEAIRRVPEGGVIACTHSEKDYSALIEQSALLDELSRPKVVKVKGANWLALQQTTDAPVTFDGIVSRNALMAVEDKLAAIQQLGQLLSDKGKIAIAESIPSRGQRLSHLLDAAKIAPDLYWQLSEAEAHLYNNPEDPMVNWDVPDLQRDFETAGLDCEIEVVTFQSQVVITSELLARWLGGKYGDHLMAHGMSVADVERVRSHFNQQLNNQTVPWSRSIAFISAVQSQALQP